MKKTLNEMTVPEIAMLAITRIALGAGIGMLASTRLGEARRSAAGWALLLLGIVTTVPLAFELFGDTDR
jgi:predicted aspartyl protease